MNTLCEPVAPGEVEQQAGDAVWDFRYPLIAPAGFPSAREAAHVEREIRVQRAESAAVEAARQNGMRQGEAQAEAAMAQRVEQERRAILEAVEQFAKERREYFRRVETDVVTLALAIARKLLHREAQIDPLLLSGIVRVALEQIQAGSQVVLRCSPPEQGSWQSFLSSLPESAREITVLADDAVDWVENFLKPGGQSAVEKTIASVAKGRGYLQAPDGCYAVAACEVLAAAQGRPSADLPKDVAALAKRLSSKPSDSVRKNARDALERILGKESELRALWKDAGGSFDKWKKTIEDLKSRV